MILLYRRLQGGATKKATKIRTALTTFSALTIARTIAIAIKRVPEESQRGQLPLVSHAPSFSATNIVIVFKSVAAQKTGGDKFESARTGSASPYASAR